MTTSYRCSIPMAVTPRGTVTRRRACLVPGRRRSLASRPWPMNVKPVPTLDERINDIRMRTAEIVNERDPPERAQALARPRDGGADEAERKESQASCASRSRRR